MSNDKPIPIDNTEKLLADNEAFIDDLYQQIASESEDEKALYPVDKQLDETILAQARKAVASKPKVVKTRKQKWFIPVSTAASLVLVSVLVWQQKDIPLAPELELAPIPQQSTAETTEIKQQHESLEVERFAVSAQNSNVTAESIAPQATKKAMPTAISVRAKDEKLSGRVSKAPQRTASQSEPLAFADINIQEQADLAKSSLTEEIAELSAKKAPVFVKRKVVSSEKIPTDMPKLTAELRTKFIKQKVQWQLVDVQQDYYILELAGDDNNSLSSEYLKVYKVDFIIDSNWLTESEKMKRSFELIKLSQ